MTYISLFCRKTENKNATCAEPHKANQRPVIHSEREREREKEKKEMERVVERGKERDVQGVSYREEGERDIIRVRATDREREGKKGNTERGRGRGRESEGLSCVVLS